VKPTTPLSPQTTPLSESQKEIPFQGTTLLKAAVIFFHEAPASVVLNIERSLPVTTAVVESNMTTEVNDAVVAASHFTHCPFAALEYINTDTTKMIN
jgi:PII-like signaling protein